MNPANITFREKTASREEIYAHLCACNRSYKPPLNEKVEILEYSNKLFEKSVTFEAWSGESLVGLVAAYLDDPSDFGYISNVSVTAGFRGKKIGKLLIEMCISRSRKRNIHEIRLEVSKDSIQAVELYKKLGFKELGSSGSSILMQLRLDGIQG
jgi:ribosomal protein S18 acetylase RimI-like enzyme